LSNNKKIDYKGHTYAPPVVKVGEGVREKAPSDKEKGEGPSSTQKEKREQTPLEKAHAGLEAKAKDAAERHDQWLRLGAEFENYKKRMQKEKFGLMKFGNESLLKAALPILDNLERTIDHGKKMNENGLFCIGLRSVCGSY